MNPTITRRILALLAATLLLLGSAPARAASPIIGIVLLHGQGGVVLGHASPNGRTIGATLLPALRKAGYLVATPEMCYSGRRIYDRTFTDCFADVDAAVADLRARGASAIVVGGQSLGGLMAIAYAATHPGLLGVIAAAPAHDAANISHRPAIAAALDGARAAIAAGHGDAVQTFPDINTGVRGRYELSVKTTPTIYVSFCDPAGPATIAGNVANLTVPLLWIAGTSDPTQLGRSDFDHAPANAHNAYVEIDSDHLSTLDNGTGAILDWLRALAAQN